MNSPISGAVVSWLGMSGGVMTLFSHLESVLKLANWAHLLATTWGKWVNEFWNWVFGWIAFDLTSGARFQVTMAIFIILLVVGCQLSRMAGKESAEDRPIGWRNIASFNVAVAVLIFLALSLFVFFGSEMSFFSNLSSWEWTIYTVANYAIYALCIVIGLARWPWFSAISVAAAMVLMSLVFHNTAASLGAVTGANQTLSLAIGTVFAILSGVTILAMAPPQAFTQKVWLLFIGLASIIALNELSKVGLSTIV
jgi:hypothetical protein